MHDFSLAIKERFKLSGKISVKNMRFQKSERFLTTERIIQKHAMEILDEKWVEFLCTDAMSLYERNGLILQPENFEAIIDSITDIWASETKPSWTPEQTLRPASATFFCKTTREESRLAIRPESARSTVSTRTSIFGLQESKKGFQTDAS